MEIPSVNIDLANGHFKKTHIHSNILLPIRVYWEVEGIPLLSVFAQAAQRTRGNYKGAMCDPEWLTARQ